MKNPFESGSPTLRFLLIGVTVLLLLIPLSMVRGVTSERQSFFEVTLNDIGNAWGTVMRKKALKRVAPSTIAASSNSIGIVSK